MCAKKLVISDYDKARLERKIEQVLTEAEVDQSNPELAYVKQLAGEIQKARIVPPEKIPPDVVTMNSTVELKDEESGREIEYTLSFPANSDPVNGRISILAPVGIALLGSHVGDVIQWPVPKGTCKYRVLRIVYQPEAAGDYSK